MHLWKRKSVFQVTLAAFLIPVATVRGGVVDLGSNEQRQAGKELYSRYCIHCHGADGDGQSDASPYFHPRPRDFTGGKYKIRTTASGELPTDQDIKNVIRKGMPFTGMPPFPAFTDQELANLTYYLKAFSEDFSDPDFIVPPLSLPDPPKITEESVIRGREVFMQNECFKCHGEQGRGNGPSAPTLENDLGEFIRAADLTKPSTFRGGPTRKDIYRTFTTGLNGTPMPSYQDPIAEEDRWHLVNYIDSLGEGDAANFDSAVVAQRMEGSIDLEWAEYVFLGVKGARFPIVGQVIEPGREFFPSANAVEVKAVYNEEKVAFLLTWHDMRPDRKGQNAPGLPVKRFEDRGPSGITAQPAAGEGSLKYSDAVALQFPFNPPEGFKKPYLFRGDSKNPVDLWFIDLANPNEVKTYTGSGFDALTLEKRDKVTAISAYEDGKWTVVLERKRSVEEGLSFEPGEFVPFAISIWDGFNEEHGAKCGITGWYSVYLKPPQEQSAVIPMAGFASFTMVVEGLLIFLLRRLYGEKYG